MAANMCRYEILLLAVIVNMCSSLRFLHIVSHNFLQTF
jgi:hypothetical protein